MADNKYADKKRVRGSLLQNLTAVFDKRYGKQKSLAGVVAVLPERGAGIAVTSDNNDLFDEKVKVTSNDTTSNYLLNKTAAGLAITLTELNDGGDEDMEIAVNEAAIDHNSIANTHNLTTDINHNTINNTHNLTTDIDHGSISGLGDDDHPKHPNVDGRAGGQTLIGGTGSGENLLLKSTSHATKGQIQIGFPDAEAVIMGGTVAGYAGVSSGGTLFNGRTAPSSSVIHEFNIDGSTIHNQLGADADFRVESDDDANCLFVDGGEDRVGIGTNAPADKFDVMNKLNVNVYGAIQDNYNGVQIAAAGSILTPDLLSVTFTDALPDTDYSLQLTGRKHLYEGMFVVPAEPGMLILNGLCIVTDWHIVTKTTAGFTATPKHTVIDPSTWAEPAIAGWSIAPHHNLVLTLLAAFYGFTPDNDNYTCDWLLRRH